jgi:archaellum component FlaC
MIGDFQSNKSTLTKKYKVLSTLFSAVTTELKLFRDSKNKLSSSVSYKNGEFG